MISTDSCLNQQTSPDPGSSHFCGSMCEAKSETDTNCWMSPSGAGFMIRGKTYVKDGTKVAGGDPFLKLIAVDWFKTNNPASKVALHPKCLLQFINLRSEAGKKLPFVLVMNLQVPAKPNYSLVLYYASNKPIAKDTLLGRFIDETNTFRDSRFKLIPSIVEGYWMVKRAVGTKACLLGKAVTCNYLRQDNFLEIDVDIGSSSVARSVIGIVLGYVTSIVVDLAILIEGKEPEELPEYILGTVRLNRVRPESAVPLDD
ncbi:protein ENHANCED DISEASE RESISTANCE 2-like [Bidens hawaiensis]|uniref:protein ENHANCED DISEASE RESISTANCE 2-like n=1 Tax=Bidens hawaiensis TaxID=980011 RepID=UPI00404A38C6